MYPQGTKIFSHTYIAICLHMSYRLDKLRCALSGGAIDTEILISSLKILNPIVPNRAGIS